MKKILLLLFFTVKFASGQMPPICFMPYSTISTSTSGCLDLVSADFDSDGKLDIAATDQISNSVVLFIGNGSGGFSLQSSTNYSTGAYPKELVAGDFNSDGKMDVVTVNSNSNNISVLLGTGTGSFIPQTTYTVPNFPKTIVKGDFNNDGKLDLATGNYSGGNISILMGVGNGSFSPIVNYAGVSGIEDMTCGDFNNDGKLDLATCCWTNFFILVYYGNGNGTFQTAINCPMAPSNNYGGSIVSADFNNDNYDDVAVWDALSYSVTAFFGTPTNTMTSGVVIGASGGNFIRMSAKDVNGDGNIDIVTPYSVSLLGNGSGSFTTVPTYTNATSANAVIVDDFNLDNKPDIALIVPIFKTLLIGLNGPQIATQFIPNYICAGHTITLTAVGANTYTWMNGPTTPTFAVSPTVTTTYTFVGQNTASGCTNTSNITVTVNVNATAADLAFITINSSSPTTVCAGSTINVCASGASNYTWSTNSNSACISDVPSITTTYSVIAKTNKGCYHNMSYTQIVDACSGIDEIKIAENAMGVYPNPTTNYININNDYTTTLSCLITNTLGKVERVFTINSGKNTIDLMDLKEGIYFFTLIDKDKTLGYTKIFVTK